MLWNNQATASQEIQSLCSTNTLTLTPFLCPDRSISTAPHVLPTLETFHAIDHKWSDRDVLFHKLEKALWPGKGEVSSCAGSLVEQEGCMEGVHGGEGAPGKSCSWRLPTLLLLQLHLPQAFTAKCTQWNSWCLLSDLCESRLIQMIFWVLSLLVLDFPNQKGDVAVGT